MIPQGDGHIEAILKRANDVAGDLQPWSNYFESKADELRTILNFYSMRNGGNVLEAGCGNGFTASLLAGRAKRVIAFDLPLEDPISHSIGIRTAGELKGRLGIENMGVIGGSVEEFPFPNGSFDIILLGYVLHYVKKRDKALREMQRVLDDKGALIAVVPNFTERLFAPFIKYEYLIKRALSYTLKHQKPKTQSRLDGGSCPDRSRNKINSLTNWLLLKPDGAYKSFMEELWEHRPSSWKSLFAANGFKVVNIFSVQLLPLGLFGIFGRTAGRFIAQTAYKLNCLVGNSIIAKRIAYSLGIVAIKS